MAVFDKYNMKNLNEFAKDLFNKIRGRFPSVTIGDADGNITNQIETARYFDFSFMNEGEDLGKVSINLDEDEGLVVIVGRDLVQNQMEDVQDRWFNFLKELRVFAKKRMLNFDVRDINKSNLNKRDYSFLAANRSGENTMAESKIYGTKNTSFQKIGNARLAIKHSAPIGEGENRLKNIRSLFIETPDGERIKYPVKHLQGARALALHVSEGGHPYDEFGKYITGLSEELASLGKFKTYMNRKSVMAEALQGYMDVVSERVKAVRKEVQNLQKPAYYAEAVANYVAPENVEVPEEVAENWIDQLTVKQFNEELKDVFPYIYNLVSEATKAQELEFDDIVGEAKNKDGKEQGSDGKACWPGYRYAGTENGKDKCVPTGKGKPKKESIDDMIEAAFEAMMGQFAEAEGNDEFDELVSAANEMADEAGFVGDINYGETAQAREMFMSGDIDGAAKFLVKSISGIKNNVEGAKEIYKHLVTGMQAMTDQMGELDDEEDAISKDKDDDTMDVKIGPQGMEKADDKPEIAPGEFILSYFDREKGTFPKGETAVLTAVQKEYGDKFVKPAAKFMQKITAMSQRNQAEEMADTRYPETEMIKQLAGI